MTKIIKEMLPPDVRVARDTRDLLIGFCVGIMVNGVFDGKKMMNFFLPRRKVLVDSIENLEITRKLSEAARFMANQPGMGLQLGQDASAAAASK
ncbi:hypothetical protein Ccrd_025045 [Cynara cardunculus var. scolymus]|uniref:Uncharacterized protein n=1 Tax=Cynara cardunculus var. scolymus TaxID=59895 RepID=A0A103XBI2_CYNCS|nr:hypothetical protein Ccrd_025045 [Cynara cardunculus var. scolymus]